ncbi:hypothetical protein [Polaribacter cellanae]|uniref:Uncharacterized protein n=1 Tax=Polaribacter cellanae TaxID=2818493 RepID=A0A975H8N6_9FLAO|nr:hypothetical protein [Polaribacter cellanae]QTE24313.1 hypothetical protein J3359_08650 [Polaribacter cellanae]
MGLFKIALIICISSIVILFITYKKGSRQDMLSYISTLMATLFGVLLAVTLSNRSNINKEKKDTIKLINTANTIVSSSYNYSRVIHKYVEELAKDSIANSNKIKIVIKRNPLPYPEMLKSILTNQIVSKNISEYMQKVIYNNLYNLKKTHNFADIFDYENVLEELKLALELEAKYQQEKISLSVMIDTYNKEIKLLGEKYSIYNSNTIDYIYNEQEK